MNHRLKRILLIGAMHTLVYLFFLPRIVLPAIHGDVAKMFVRVVISIFMITITIVIVRRDNAKIKRRKEEQAELDQQEK
ncbi:MAG: hypothetical protein KAG98_01330 [Lentisphaeria bacterium]|nr:hypothetical protein [Lentisphaeria bacterium]